MAKYIQRKDPYGNLETVDEFESRKEAAMFQKIAKAKV